MAAPGNKALVRLTKELQKLKETPLAYARAEPAGDNLLAWKAEIDGPKGSPFEGGVFALDMKFPDNYPMKAPTVVFVTKVYHPSVKKDSGAICADVIENNWSPVLSIANVLERIYKMLAEPASESPLEPEIGEVLQSNPKKFAETAKQWTKKYATK